jgi:hypothetical protein
MTSCLADISSIGCYCLPFDTAIEVLQTRREAYVSAYSDAFWIVGVGLIISLSAIALLKRPQRTAAPIEAQ